MGAGSGEQGYEEADGAPVEDGEKLHDQQGEVATDTKD